MDTIISNKTIDLLKACVINHGLDVILAESVEEQ